jgi:AraC family transcriptional activator of tynA and feaB
MEILFSTRTVHPRERFNYWHAVACQQLVDHEARPKSRLGFDAEISTGLLGHVGLVQFQNSPMTVLHTKKHISRTTSDDLFVCRQVSGSVILEQGMRQVKLQDDQITVIDPLLPYACNFLHGSKMLVVRAPRRELEGRAGKAFDLTMRLIKPDRSEHILTAKLLGMLPSFAGNMSAMASEMVANQALDLIAVCLCDGEQRARASTSKSLCFLRIQAATESRLADPKLDTKTVADSVGISVRYANKVLATYDTSIRRMILAKRLARCRAALADPNQTHRSVSDIAYGWGFSDMTHFGRRFKEAYGVLPSEVQANARQLQKNRS